MEGLKKHYDRVILIAAAVIAIVISALIAKASFGFAKNFERKAPAPGKDFGATDPAPVESATARFGTEVKWEVPQMEGQAGKGLTLFRSVTIVEKDGVVYDLLDPSSPMLRPPMENVWLVENGLDFKRDDVGKLDPDGDGFPNAEEFEWGKENPRDPKAHPPYTKHLYVEDVILEPYTLEFKSESGGTFTVQRKEEKSRKSMFGKLNQPFDDPKGDGGRFTPIKYTKIEEEGASGFKRDVSTLELADANNPGKNIVLTHRVPYDMPIKHAKLGFRQPGHENWDKDVKEGDSFQLPNDPSVSLKLISVEDDGSARVSQPDPAGGNPKLLEIPAG